MDELEFVKRVEDYFDPGELIDFLGMDFEDLWAMGAGDFSLFERIISLQEDLEEYMEYGTLRRSASNQRNSGDEFDGDA